MDYIVLRNSEPNPMRPIFPELAVRSVRRHAPLAIAFGLAVLLVTADWPGAPVVSAFAMVTLGATGATFHRFRHSTALLPVMLMHIAVYGSLYALFIGATLHAAYERSGARLDLITLVDIVVSIVPMLLAVQLVWRSLEGERTGDA